jgi:L-alanine-DL-glutamate epimerase-like enolase superfamily enzyme
MKIVAVEVDLVQVPAVDPPFRWRDGLPGSEPEHVGGLLRLRTDDGPDGIAWCERGVILADLVDRRIRAGLLGEDPLRREALWHRMWELDRIEEFPIYIQGVVDVALWDLAGKSAGLPVHRLAGGFRDEIEAYASTTTFASIEEYLDVADQSLALGYPAIKLHAWGDPKRDAALITRLRDHVGDRIPLMYDGSAGFDLADAIYVGRACTDAGYLWYEEPMREFNITQYRWLAERVGVPLLVAETSDGAHYTMADWVVSGCATFVRTCAAFKAGFTGGLRIAHLAEAFGLRAEVHGGGLVHAQLALTIPNTTYYESLVRTNPVQREPLVGADGFVRLSETPGFGLDPDALLGS